MNQSNNKHVPGFDSKDIWQQDKDHHMHPWSDMHSVKEHGAIIMEKGEGCYIFDTNGKKYLDSVGGLWCNNIGLGRSDMAEAVAEQITQLSFNSTFNDLGSLRTAELAARIAELAPGNLNHVHFTTGGSTAIDTAHRLIELYHYVRGNTDKKQFISRENAYHGSTMVGASLGGKAGDRQSAHSYLNTIHHISNPNYYRAPKSMSEAEFLDMLVQELEDKINEIGADNVAAFFAEPILGAGGVVVPPEGYHQLTHEVCKKYDVLYVSDEVVTAFGRLGHWFASEDEFGIVPDIITSAKGITSGVLPLGACIFSDEIFETITADDSGVYFSHGLTYSGHPVCCAAALKNIEIIENEGILEHVKEVGPYFGEQLETLSDLAIVGDVRGSQLMRCIEFVADKETKTDFPEEFNIGKWVSDHADKRGLMIRPIVNLTVMSPPLTISKEEIDFIVSTLRESIIATMDELREKGLWGGDKGS
ncbi:MAG: aminotransferase [Gammaproteobacteria bacterium]|nr:MAG: aminotransferase [Gammaproteobacteria bacterium]